MLIGFDIAYIYHGSFEEFPTNEYESKVQITIILALLILVIIGFLSRAEAWKLWIKNKST